MERSGRIGVASLTDGAPGKLSISSLPVREGGDERRLRFVVRLFANLTIHAGTLHPGLNEFLCQGEKIIDQSKEPNRFHVMVERNWKHAGWEY